VLFDPVAQERHRDEFLQQSTHKWMTRNQSSVVMALAGTRC
jgi:hypothetical protein